MKDDKEESQSKKFLKSSKGPATPSSSSTKSFLKQQNQTNGGGGGGGSIGAKSKKLATTLESDEFETDRKPYGKDDDYDVNIDEDLEEENTKIKEMSNRYSDDFDESKSQRNIKNSNVNNNNSLAISSMSFDQKRNGYEKKDKNEYDDEMDDGEEEMSEQASSSRPSQQSVIQRKSSIGNTSKWRKFFTFTSKKNFLSFHLGLNILI